MADTKIPEAPSGWSHFRPGESWEDYYRSKTSGSSSADTSGNGEDEPDDPQDNDGPSPTRIFTGRPKAEDDGSTDDGGGSSDDTDEDEDDDSSSSRGGRTRIFTGRPRPDPTLEQVEETQEYAAQQVQEAKEAAERAREAAGAIGDSYVPDYFKSHQAYRNDPELWERHWQQVYERGLADSNEAAKRLNAFVEQHDSRPLDEANWNKYNDLRRDYREAQHHLQYTVGLDSEGLAGYFDRIDAAYAAAEAAYQDWQQASGEIEGARQSALDLTNRYNSAHLDAFLDTLPGDEAESIRQAVESDGLARGYELAGEVGERLERQVQQSNHEQLLEIAQRHGYKNVRDADAALGGVDGLWALGYADAVSYGQIAIEDVPAEYREGAQVQLREMPTPADRAGQWAAAVVDGTVDGSQVPELLRPLVEQRLPKLRERAGFLAQEGGLRPGETWGSPEHVARIEERNAAELAAFEQYRDRERDKYDFLTEGMRGGRTDADREAFQQAWDKYNFLTEGARGGRTDVDRQAFQQAWDKYDFLSEGTRGGPTDADRQVFQQAWDKYNFLTEGTPGGPTDADRQAFQQAWDKYNFLSEGMRGGPTDADRQMDVLTLFSPTLHRAADQAAEAKVAAAKRALDLSPLKEAVETAQQELHDLNDQAVMYQGGGIERRLDYLAQVEAAEAKVAAAKSALGPLQDAVETAQTDYRNWHEGIAYRAREYLLSRVDAGNENIAQQLESKIQADRQNLNPFDRAAEADRNAEAAEAAELLKGITSENFDATLSAIGNRPVYVGGQEMTLKDITTDFNADHQLASQGGLHRPEVLPAEAAKLRDWTESGYLTFNEPPEGPGVVVIRLPQVGQAGIFGDGKVSYAAARQRIRAFERKIGEAQADGKFIFIEPYKTTPEQFADLAVDVVPGFGFPWSYYQAKNPESAGDRHSSPTEERQIAREAMFAFAEFLPLPVGAAAKRSAALIRHGQDFVRAGSRPTYQVVSDEFAQDVLRRQAYGETAVSPYLSLHTSDAPASMVTRTTEGFGGTWSPGGGGGLRPHGIYYRPPAPGVGLEGMSLSEFRRFANLVAPSPNVGGRVHGGISTAGGRSGTATLEHASAQGQVLDLPAYDLPSTYVRRPREFDAFLHRRAGDPRYQSLAAAERPAGMTQTWTGLYVPAAAVTASQSVPATRGDTNPFNLPRPITAPETVTQQQTAPETTTASQSVPATWGDTNPFNLPRPITAPETVTQQQTTPETTTASQTATRPAEFVAPRIVTFPSPAPRLAPVLAPYLFPITAPETTTAPETAPQQLVAPRLAPVLAPYLAPAPGQRLRIASETAPQQQVAPAQATAPAPATAPPAKPPPPPPAKPPPPKGWARPRIPLPSSPTSTPNRTARVLGQAYPHEVALLLPETVVQVDLETGRERRYLQGPGDVELYVTRRGAYPITDRHLEGHHVDVLTDEAGNVRRSRARTAIGQRPNRLEQPDPSKGSIKDLLARASQRRPSVQPKSVRRPVRSKTSDVRPRVPKPLNPGAPASILRRLGQRKHGVR